MTDENLAPEQEEMNLSVDSVKAGAAVFGSLVFGTEFPEHSLCYSPSPALNRHNSQNNIENLTETSKAIDFDSTPTMSSKQNKEIDDATIKRGGSRRTDLRHTALKPSSTVNIFSRPTIDITAKGSSVNPIINDVRRSKEENINQKIISAAQTREQRRLERQDAMARNAEIDNTRIEVLKLRKQLNNRFARAKTERENRARQEQLAKVENEIQFKSKVHVEHKQTLKEMEDARRRMSIDDRAKLRQNYREGKERMKLAAISEDQALYEERHEGSLAIRNTKAKTAEKRRQSYAFRNGDARRIRELFAKMKSDEFNREHESYELKWAGERDAEAYKQKMAKERRESLAFRNAEGNRIRDVEATMKSDEFNREHESYELKWAGERDAEDYKQKMAKERRESLAFRNAEGRRIRDVEATMKSDEFNREHESYELKWAGERDAEDYKQKMAEERRESLAFRNAEGRRIRDVEATMKSDEFNREHESYELKWAGERDAEAYKQELAKERRDSFAFRNAEGHRIRDVEATMKSDEFNREHESFELKWAGERDAEAYRQQMAKERRESFAARNAEGARHDAVMKELRSLARDQEHESFMLKWAGENDAKQYLADQQELRRQSFAFRNAEGRRHREIEEDMRAHQILENQKNEELAAACRKDVENYKAECAAKERASLRLQGEDHFGNRVQAEIKRQEKIDQDHESHLLDTAAWQDVNDYVDECKRRRRLSLAFRAKEKRRHLEYAKQQAVLEVQRQHRDTQYRSEDARYVELAKLKEKAMIAIDSFNRSPTCTFGANPFAAVLD